MKLVHCASHEQISKEVAECVTAVRAHKRDELLTGKVTTAAPVSFLALHGDVDVCGDESSATAGT